MFNFLHNGSLKTAGFTKMSIKVLEDERVLRQAQAKLATNDAISTGAGFINTLKINAFANSVKSASSPKLGL